MKKIVLASLILACLPYLSWAQSSDDDLYFIPKKKTENRVTTTQTVDQVIPKNNNKNYSSNNAPVVVRDASGRVRDVDEYNRRYSSKDNNFVMDNDTLYIEEKPYGERGEWVNGFEGSQDDYEYAMRIVRFRNPFYAIPISSPLYWDVVYTLNSWDWNVYDDGFYAYAFPTFSNRLWWDWRWNYPYGGGLGMSYNWYSPWYNNWYYPSWNYGWNYGWGYGWDYGWNYGRNYGWGGPSYGGYHNWGRPNIGSNIRNGNGVYDNRRADYRPDRTSRRVDGVNYRTSGSRVSGRVVNSSDNNYSVRPQRTVQPSKDINSTRIENSVRGDRTYPSSSYTRPSMNRGESSYSRPSSTRSSVREGGSDAMNRSYNSERSYNSSRNSYQSSGSSNSFRSSSSSGSSGSYQSSGGSSSSSSGGGGGARRR
jgi:hypothetical protein